MTSEIQIVKKVFMKRNKAKIGKDFGLSNRQLRVGELVRRNISVILSRGDIYEEELENTPITVSEVRCSSDLKLALVYVIPLGGKNLKQVVSVLTKRKSEIRKHLGRKLNIKFVPDLRFLEDTSFDQMDKTNELLSNPTVIKDLRSEKKITNA